MYVRVGVQCHVTNITIMRLIHSNTYTASYTNLMVMIVTSYPTYAIVKLKLLRSPQMNNTDNIIIANIL